MPTDTPEKPSYYKTITRLPFMDLRQGDRVIRLLDERAPGFQTHYLKKQGVSIHCIGKECPICKRNDQIYFENPKGFRDNPEFISSREIYIINVLDLTNCKTCPECGTDNYPVQGQFSPTCSKCETIITTTEAKPSNTVKILMQGKDLFNTLNVVEANMLKKNPVFSNWTKYNLLITTTGKNRDTTRAVQADETQTEAISEELLAKKAILSTVLIELVPDEIEQAVRGVSLKDIFAARKATAENTSAKLETEVSEETKAIVDGLMN
jgi:endogenous inhibitor of DNA gyrase (YacG/DUF329 family)